MARVRQVARWRGTGPSAVEPAPQAGALPPVPDGDRAAAATCPRCGRPNDCALAAGASPAAACWCAAVLIAPPALADLPPAARGRACLCPRCARGE